jgi:hypothetical protein
VFSEAISIANNHDFILEACIDQITKDLGLELGWFEKKPNSIQSIVLELNSQLEKLLFNSEGIIHQLLYKVDLNEEQLYSQMNSGNHKSLSDLLSKSIVERELKKVIMRNVYSGKLKL